MMLFTMPFLVFKVTAIMVTTNKLTHIFLQAMGVAPERLVRAADSVSVSLLV